MRLEGSEQGNVAVVTRVCPSEQEFQRLPCACCVRSWSSGGRKGWMGVSGGALEPLERSEPCWGWQLGSAGLDTARSCAVLLGRFLLVGCVWGRFLLMFCLPQGEPQGCCKHRMGLGRPQASLGGLWGPTGSGRDSPVPSHICCPRTLLSGWKRCWWWMLLLLAAPEKLCCWLSVAAKSQTGGVVCVH